MDINQQVLMSDRYYNKLSDTDILTIKDKAPKLASILVQKYPKDKMYNILQHEQFDIIDTTNAKDSLVKYRARIEIKQVKKIYVYKDSITEMVEKFPQVSVDQARLMFIAHEFIHYLEFCNQVDTKFYIKTGSHFFSRKLNVHAFSEIVANEYARIISNSPINPMEIDKEKYEV